MQENNESRDNNGNKENNENRDNNGNKENNESRDNNGLQDNNEAQNNNGLQDNNEAQNNNESQDFIGEVLEQLQLPVPEIKKYSPLTLAYLGDCVYEIVIRTMFVYQGNAPVNKLHARSCHLVKAKSQSDMIRALDEILTEEEKAVYKRGRNAYSVTRAKNASVSDYRRATGFEALMGYLYMEKQYKRIVELVRIGLEKMGQI